MKWFKFFLISSLFLPITCQAIGVSVEPAELDILYPSQEKYSFTVTNISAEPIVVSTYVDAFQDNVSLQPNEIKLLPKEVTEVVVKADFIGTPAGVKNTYISIISKAIDKRSFNAASGIKLPLSVNITESTWRWSGEAVFVVVFLSLMVLIILVQLIFLSFQAKKKKRHWRGTNFLLHKKKFRLFKR